MTRGGERVTADVAPPAPLLTLAKRAHVRVVIPPGARVYATVRSARAVGSARGLVLDIGAAGVAVALTEGGRFEPPPLGDDATVVLDFEGQEARAAGRVVRTSAREVSLALPPAGSDEALNLELLSLLAAVVTRRAVAVERRLAERTLAARLTHRRYHGAGHLDIRVQPEEPAWWQIVFLEYVVGWRRGVGLGTGLLDGSFSVERARDPLAVGPSVTLHAEPWPKLVTLAAAIAARCAAALPAQAEVFDVVRRTTGAR